MNDSSTGGYIAPTDAIPPEEDSDLDRLLQKIIVGLTGLAGSLVRPRWQPTVPKQPEANVNWCAIGIMDIEQDDTPSIQHQPAANGADQFIRHEIISVLASFYGPGGMSYAAQVRDGITIPQNSEAMKASNMGLINVSKITAAPDFYNETWIRRWDLSIKLRRRVLRTYPVLNILSASPEYHSDNP